MSFSQKAITENLGNIYISIMKEVDLDHKTKILTHFILYYKKIKQKGETEKNEEISR